MAKDNKKIRVLEVVSGLSPEGIGTFVLNVFENIDKDKVEISFALATEYEQFYEDRLLKQGAKIYRTYEIGYGLIGKVRHFINLIKIIKKEGPFDVVHSHMDFFNGINLFAAFIARVPLRISHAHINVDKKYLSKLKLIYNSFMRCLIRIFSNKKVGCSIGANIYVNGCNNEKNIINNGIDLDKFNVEKKKKNKNEISFITIGRIESAKNPIFIVEIMNELVKRNRNIKLKWIGVGSLQKEVSDLIGRLDLNNNIQLLGKRSDIPNLLAQSDFMIFPSKWEGLGIVLIEAQAAKVPCFISNAIPKEADIGLCTILDLKDSAEIWSENIIKSIENMSYKKQLNKNLLEQYNIKNVCRKIEIIYGGE